MPATSIDFEPRILHLEPTDACQAACALCARETDPNFDAKHVHHLTFDQIQQVFSASKIAALEKMFMCGVYGDPAAGRHSLEIYSEFRQINPGIVLGMNTNGGLRDSAWWQRLAQLFNQPRDYVVFSIDGLADTNHVYRKNVIWSRVIENARTFIQNGGSAHWDMLVYRHNEHQVDQAIELARSLGFTWFRAKVSKRPVTQNLEYPVHWQRPATPQGSIVCMAVQDASVYIDARGRLHPCCWQADPVKQTSLLALSETWSSDTPDAVCVKTCSQNTSVSNAFDQQWQLEIQLK